MTTGRLEAFSDGVFAIAVTLLVLNVHLPDPASDHVVHDLEAQWPEYAAYVVTFFVIGIMWVNHHTLIGLMARVDRTLLFFNLLLLMAVAFLPFSAGLFGQQLQAGHDERVAAVAYSLVMEAAAVAYTLIWGWAARAGLLATAVPRDRLLRTTVRFSSGVPIYGATVLVALANPYACLAAHGALALYYMADQLSGVRGGDAAKPATSPGPG